MALLLLIWINIVLVSCVYVNQNNVFGRAELKADNCNVKYLGQFSTQEACIQACQKYIGPGGLLCRAWTYHLPAFGAPWAEGCYAVTTFSWNPTTDENVNSDKVGTWPEEGECADDSACNYNGKCVNKKCKCVPQWKGEACDVLNLLPSDKKLGLHGSIDGQNVTSWGGSVLVDDDGTYHMWAAEISGFCGMNVWLANSQIIHATSKDPVKYPFERQDIPVGVFSHEPIAARAPTGEYVLYVTAVLPPLLPPVRGGKHCKGCKNGISIPSCGTDEMRNSSQNLPTYMLYSKSPSGPWSDPQMVPGTDVYADSNLAPVINKDGSVIALTRDHVVVASDWKDISTYKFSEKWEDHGEDPYVWKDVNGIFHNIIHVNRINTHGLHYFSEDGVCWTPSPGKGYAYTNRINYTDGSYATFACRERPHIMQNENKDIIALTNGASLITCHDEHKNDYSWTLLQVVGQS